MNVRSFTRSLATILFAVPGALVAQEHFAKSRGLAPHEEVQITSTLNEFVNRLEALEAKADSPTSTKGGKQSAAALPDMEADGEDSKPGKGADDGFGGISAKATQQWTGRVHFDFWGYPQTDAGADTMETGSAGERPQDHWSFRRLRFGPAGDIGDNMLYKIEMEFAAPNKMAFKDAYLGWQDLPLLQTLVLGNQKRPYGLDHLNSSRYNVFTERPFVVEAFNQDARRFGLLSYGVSDDLAFNWRWGAFLLKDVANDGKYASIENEIDGDAYTHHQAELAGRLANTFVWENEGRTYAHWAISGSVADPDGGVGHGTNEGRFYTRPEARTSNRWLNTGRIANVDEYFLFGVEGAVNLGALQFVGEYMSTRVLRDGDDDLDFSGGYVYTSYFLTGEHTPWSRTNGVLGRVKPFNPWKPGSGWSGGAWQLAVRYSHGDFTDDDIFGGVGNSVTAGVNWWWNSRARVQFNYIHGSISDSKVVSGELADGDALTGDYSIIGTRFMLDF